MRVIKRFTLAVTAAVIFLTVLIILSKSTPKPSTSRRATPSTHSGRPYKKPTPLPWNPPRPRPASTRKPTSQLIVKVHLPDEDISWLSSLASTWTNNLIPIDARFTRLHAGAQRADKGRTATAYLAWIIQNYHNLPTNIVFLGPANPPARNQDNHNHNHNHNNNPSPSPHTQTQRDIHALRLPFLQKTGFAPLPCPPPAACADPLRPFAQQSAPPALRTLDVSTASAWRALFNSTRVPTGLAAVPNTQFAVSRAQVLARGVGEYERFWAWLQRTKMDDESAGLLLELLWPVVFGRAEVFCPEFRACQCEVFGRC
jgi:hypothetical protein